MVSDVCRHCERSEAISRPETALANVVKRNAQPDMMIPSCREFPLQGSVLKSQRTLHRNDIPRLPPREMGETLRREFPAPQPAGMRVMIDPSQLDQQVRA
jgi:hypothetical protein